MAKLWPYAEVKRGLSVREDFPSADRLSNDWTLVGSPGVDDGLHLDGTNYARRNLVGSEFNSPEISIALKFVPLFEADDGQPYALIDASVTNEDDFLIAKDSTDRLRVDLGNTTVFSVPPSTYQSVWEKGKVNTIVVRGSAGGGTSYLCLNNVEIASSTTLWSVKLPTIMYVGALDNGDWEFLGTIKEVKVFKQKLTQQEAIDYHNNETYCWRSKAVVDLPMLQAQHDPPLTLDVSGNGDHGTLDGVVKLDRRGYEFNGIDNHIDCGAGIQNNLSQSIICMFSARDVFNPGVQGLVTNGSTAGATKQYMGIIGGRIYYVNTVNTISAEIRSGANYTAIGVREVIGGETISRLYLDGILVANDTTAGTPDISLTDLIIGWINLDRYFPGKIFQVVFTDFAVTPTQVYDAHHQMRTQARMI